MFQHGRRRECQQNDSLADGCSQAAAVKAANPRTRVMVYRNLVKALPWFPSVRAKLTDPAFAGWFLHYRDGVHGSGYSSPPCTGGKCSALFHDADQTPQHDPHADGSCKAECDCGDELPCGEYLWVRQRSRPLQLRPCAAAIAAPCSQSPHPPSLATYRTTGTGAACEIFWWKSTRWARPRWAARTLTGSSWTTIGRTARSPTLGGGLRKGSARTTRTAARPAVGETAILMHPPLPSAGVSTGMERERQQNDSLADG